MPILKPWIEPKSFRIDRKSTRLNSSHPSISYAVFCLKKKKNKMSADILITLIIISTRIQLHFTLYVPYSRFLDLIFSHDNRLIVYGLYCHVLDLSILL